MRIACIKTVRFMAEIKWNAEMKIWKSSCLSRSVSNCSNRWTASPPAFRKMCTWPVWRGMGMAWRRDESSSRLKPHLRGGISGGPRGDTRRSSKKKVNGELRWPSSALALCGPAGLARITGAYNFPLVFKAQSSKLYTTWSQPIPIELFAMKKKRKRLKNIFLNYNRSDFITGNR